MHSPTPCAQFQAEIDAAGRSSASLGGEAGAHLQQCELCGQRYADAKLLRLLHGVEVLPPRPDFADAAILSATQRGRAAMGARRRRVGWLGAIAASVAVVTLVLGALGSFRPQSDVSGGSLLQVVMAPLQSQTVRVLIDSADDRDSATITISLADNLELEGFPDDRVIEWETPLKRGKNLLPLPLRLMDGTESHLDVAFSHGQTRKKVRILVAVAEPSPLA